MSIYKFIITFLVFSDFAIAAPAPVPSDLVAWYSGDGDANDISGNNLHPTTTFGTAKFEIGKVGQSMKFVPQIIPDFFSLSDGYAVADNSLLDIDGDDSFSVEFWAKSDSLIGTWVDKREYIGGQYRGYAIYKSFNSTVQANGGNGCTIAFDIFQPGVPTQAVFTTTPSCSTTFTHYAFVFDRAANRMRIYVNGNFIIGRTPFQPIGDLSNTATFNIAEPAENSTYGNWDGDIDELSIYKKALTLGEIQAIHAAGAEGKEKSTPLPIGMAVQRRVGDLTATFPEITSGANLLQTTVEPNSQPNLPSGFVSTGLAYNISTAAIFTGNPTLCFNLPSFTDSAQFGRLRVMHFENSAWVNQTTSTDFATRTLCGQTSSFSPFAIAEQLAPLAATVSISGRVLTANGNGISKARISLVNQNGEVFYVKTSAFGYYKFEELNAGETYILNVNYKRYQFNTQIISPNENLEELNFVAVE